MRRRSGADPEAAYASPSTLLKNSGRSITSGSGPAPGSQAQGVREYLRALIRRPPALHQSGLEVHDPVLGHAGSLRQAALHGAVGPGKVERPVGYLRSNFLYGRTFLGDADLADQGTRWLARANQRVHGTTRVVPLSRLAEEQAAFLPLAGRPYRSLILTLPPPRPPSPRTPPVEVERRSLASYTQLLTEAH